MSDEKLTTTQVAELLGIARSTWSSYVGRGQAPPADGKLYSRMPYWNRSTIDAWSATRPRATPPAATKQNASGDTDERLVAQQVADRLGLTRQTWITYVHQGYGPEPDGHFNARLPYWRTSTVDTWAENRVRKGISLAERFGKTGTRLTAAQAAAIAGLSVHTWKQYASTGRAPAADGYEGRNRFWLDSTVREWVASRSK